MSVLAGTAEAGQAGAAVIDGDDPPIDCLAEVRGTIWTTSPSIPLGQSTTLRWSIQKPSGCGVTVQINGITRTGTSLVVTPTQPTTTYSLRVLRLGASRDLGVTTVVATLPRDASGRVVLVVDSNDKRWAFLEAIIVPNAHISILNHVELDLSDQQIVDIASGVSIIGGRTAREPGPRLFTTAFQEVLFALRDAEYWSGGDNVRISGLRIDGGFNDIAYEWEPGPIGFQLESRVNVEIDNNEIYGFSGAAIKVIDTLGRIRRETNSMTIRIHDNYIHHNQHAGKEGYGVSVNSGAYALIEKNVFDYNRHAIKSGGEAETGYYAYRNLVLENGGFHEQYGPVPIYTHQFDVHGQATCFPGHLNCGLAGEYFDIRHNSFFYTSGDGIKLRGTPTIGMDVVSNVFAHWWLTSDTWDAAIHQNESGMHQWENQVDTDASDEIGHCDFDGDGLSDHFMATGRTWWFNSGGNRHWVYLNTSKKRLSEISLADVDGDGQCDVTSGGVVSKSGRGPTMPFRADLLWRHTSGQLAVWLMDGGTVAGEGYPGLVGSHWQIKGTGDFSGDGYRDILWQENTGQVAIWHMAGGTKLYETYPGGQVPLSWSVQGTGDFDGDGADDILWRDTSGQLAIWLKGEHHTFDEPNGYPPLLPAVYPGYQNGEGPVGLDWTVKGIGDFNGDGRADIVWRHIGGQVAIWLMTAGLNVGDYYPGGADPNGFWQIQRVADFDGNGRSDILWRDGYGQLAIWFNGEQNGAAFPGYQNNVGPVGLEWQVQAAVDFNGDARADILWRHTNGQLAIWLMDGGWFLGDVYPRLVDNAWQIAGVLADRP